MIKAVKYFLFSLIIFPICAQAGDWDWNPKLMGEIELETEFGRNYDTDPAYTSRTSNNLFSECDDCAFRMRFTSALTATLNVGFEPLHEEIEQGDVQGGNVPNIIYNSMILYVKEAFIRYQNNRVGRKIGIDEIGFFGGKFNSTFGLQNGGLREENEFPGIFSEEFLEDYEHEELIGFGGEIAYKHRLLGNHSLTAAAFYEDNSFLNKTAISNRYRNHTWRGGASNTGSPNSFFLTLEGEDMHFLHGMRYEIGVRHLHRGYCETPNRFTYPAPFAICRQKEGLRPTGSETAYAIGLVYNKAFFFDRKKFQHPLDMKFMFEFAKFNHWAGASSVFKQNRHYITSSLRGRYGKTDLSFNHSRRYIDIPHRFISDDEIEGLEDNMGVEPEIDKDHGSDIFEVNLAYRFNQNWSGSVSWAAVQEMEERVLQDSSNIGMQLNYRYFF